MSVADTLRLIENLLEGHTDRADERAILALLEAAPAEVLVGVLDQLDLSRAIGDIDDRRVGPKHRTALVELLCRERVDELPVSVRAKLIAALSEGRTDSLDERGIRDLFLATKGAALTELKDRLDDGSDHHDLQHMIHCDIDDEETREAILAHIREEATPERRLRVLSDIDDTLYANWKDTRFPAKTVYPGVLTLYSELDREGRVAFVTARPKDRTGLIEKVTHATLRALGVQKPIVLAGSFFNLHSDSSIAEKKLANFLEYEALFPESEFAFFGDSGQGDAEFGARMRDHTDRVRSVFIHDVVASPAEVRSGWSGRGVCFFDTYIGAAHEAHATGLLDAGSIERVRAAAISDFDVIAFTDERMRGERRAELERDAAR